VSLHLRLSDATRGLIGREQLALMRDEAYLVNTARAELIDEEALVEALAASSIAGAGLDVFWEEPLAADHPLRTFPNVTLTPHMAGSAFNAQEHSAHLLATRLAGVVKSWSRNP
jgi:D-3-phosphoglycerate dehydrogenase